MALKGNIGKFKYEISSETEQPSVPRENSGTIGGLNYNVKFDPTELATGASAASPYPTAAAGIPGKIVPQRQLDNFPMGTPPTLSKIPADNVTNLVPDVLPPTTQKPTDHVTSDGQSIQSALGSAQDFYSQISMNDIVDNTPSGAMSYAGYLAYNGLVDPRQQYAQDLDAANEMYARALGTYGMAGEGLAQGNLVNSGYSEYLNGNAYTQKAGWYRQALVDYQNRQNEYGAKYAQYKQDLAAQQAEEEAQKDLPSEQSVNAYNYLIENVQNAGGLEAAKNYLAANGYASADIDAAIKSWQSTYAADTLANVDRVQSLASGNAESLKEVLGSGEDYDKAIEQLQKKNEELLMRRYADDAEWTDHAFDDFRAQYESEDGETSFDDLSEDDKINAFKDYAKRLYKSGDISEAAYNTFMYEGASRALKECFEGINQNTSEKKKKAALREAMNEMKKYRKDGEKDSESLNKLYTELSKFAVPVLTGDLGAEVRIMGKTMSSLMNTKEEGEAWNHYVEWYKKHHDDNHGKSF